MKHLHTLVFCCFLLVFGTLGGCTEQYDIKLNKKGQAEVKYKLFFTDAHDMDSLLGTATDEDMKMMRDSMRKSIDKIYKGQPGISNYKCSVSNKLEVDVSYKIKRIADLGNFLSPLGLAKFNFIPGKNNLVIESGSPENIPEIMPGEEEDEESKEGMDQMKIVMNIEMPRPVKRVINQGVFGMMYGDSKVTLTADMSQFIMSSTSNRIEIQY